MNNDNADVVVVLGSTCSNAIAPLAERAQVPLLAWAGDPAVTRGRSWVFRLGQSSELEGELIARHAATQNYGKVAFINAAGDYQHSVSTGFKRRYPAPLLALNDEVPADAEDYRSLLTRAKALGVGALGLCLHPGQHGIAAKQARELGITVPVFGCDNMQDPAELAISSGSLQGSWLVCQTVTPEFRQRYREAYGNENVIAGAAVYYEAAKVLHEVTRKGERRKELLEALMSIKDRQGAVGSYSVRESEEGRFFDIPLSIVQLE